MSLDITNLNKEYILSEVKKLQYLYGLKREIRYGQTRPADDLTESVAEHIYGMHLLAHYFLPLEDPEGKWDSLRLFSMITIHDLDEIETGDTISYLKTTDMYEAEKLAREKVVANSPTHLQHWLQDLSDEYETRTSIEARFVKAIDVFEPLIQMYGQFGRNIININKQSSFQTTVNKEAPIKPFPYLYAYFNTIHEAMIEEGYFDHS